jgi:hypothetical protein
LSSKQTFVLPTKLKRPPHAGFDSILGKITVPVVKFSKKLLDVPPLAMSRSRIVNDSAVPGGTETVTSNSALSPGRRFVPLVELSELLPATKVLVRLGDIAVVVAISDSGEKRGPPMAEAYLTTAVFVIIPPKGAVASRSTS